MARAKGRTNAEGLYLSAPKREEYLNYLYRANTKTKKEIEKLPADKRQQLKDRHPSEINWYYKRKENSTRGIRVKNILIKYQATN